MGGPLGRGDPFCFWKPSDVSFRAFFAVLFNADTVDSSEVRQSNDIIYGPGFTAPYQAGITRFLNHFLQSFAWNS